MWKRNRGVNELFDIQRRALHMNSGSNYNQSMSKIIQNQYHTDSYSGRICMDFISIHSTVWGVEKSLECVLITPPFP